VLAAGTGWGQWTATEEAKLTASEAGTRFFGVSIALSGDTALVGASTDITSVLIIPCSAYIFERDHGGPGAWGQVVKLTPSDAQDWGNLFGISVAIFGDTAVVGAPRDDAGSAAYVYERDQGGPGAWGRVARLSASAGSGGDNFGASVAVSGNTVVVGAYLDDAGGNGAGSAYIFERDQGGAGAWGEVAKLIASDAAVQDLFGYSVAVTGDTALVGAIGDDHAESTEAGSAYVFGRDQGGTGAWGEVTKLTASDAADDDWFGYSVAVAGGTAVIGAFSDDHTGGNDAGSAYVFERDPSGAGVWSEVAKLTASDAGNSDYFGGSVALSSDTAVVGAYWDDNEGGFNAGSAYVFERDQGGPAAWGEVLKLTTSDGEYTDQFGRSVAIFGDTAAVGADFDDHAGGTDAGSAYVHGISSSSRTYCTAGTSASGCQALLSATGTPSATASSGFTLSASTVEGQKDGLFFFGTNGQQANPWGNGTSYQCVVPPVVRTPTTAGVGTVGLCDGSFALDLNALWCSSCPKPAKNPGAGATVQAQLWYRDPASTSNQTTSLSDAIEFVVQP
jgi:hypothetical protein